MRARAERVVVDGRLREARRLAGSRPRLLSNAAHPLVPAGHRQDAGAVGVEEPRSSRIVGASWTPEVRRPSGAPRIRRTTYKFDTGDWVKEGPKTTGNRFLHPRQINWSQKPAEGDIFDRETGKLTKIKKGAAQPPEHYLDYAAGQRKGYGKWYGEEREKTAYSFLSGAEGGSDQGPHTFAFIGKRAAAEASVRSNKDFDPRRIKKRSALLPSPGQNRALVADHEARTGIDISKGRKRKLDATYRSLDELLQSNLDEPDLKRAKKNGPRAKRAVVEMMEASALGTYALGRPATGPELKNKNETREKAIKDIKKLSALGQGDPLPTGLEVFDPNIVGHDPKYIAQLGRAIGRLAAGQEEDLSDLDISSASEYPDESSDSESSDEP